MMRRRAFMQLGALAGLNAVSRRASASVKTFHTVIVGGGFAGSSCALQLRKLAPDMRVTLIDPDASYVTCPMSNEVLAGIRTPESLRVSRAGLAHAQVRYLRSRVSGADLDKRVLKCDDGISVAFDRLVVAPGIRFLWGSPEGYDEAASQIMPHAWKAGPQTALLAAQLHAMPDGGVVAISLPAGLMRCPPAPFERASLIASYLKAHKPRSKILIFDANNHFPKQEIFSAAWQELYPGMIDWIPVVEDGAIVRVDTKRSTLYTSHAAHKVALANIIPTQAPGQLALDLALCSGHGWCAVKPDSFESTLASNVHVIGDACAAGAMPKAASAALSQAQQCARAIVAAASGRALPMPRFDSVCYSVLGADRALAIHADFDVRDGSIQTAQAPSESLPIDASARAAATPADAHAWYQRIVTASFGG